MKQKSFPRASDLPKWFYAILGVIVLLLIYLYLLFNGQVRYAEAYVHCGWKRPILAYSEGSFDGSPGKQYYLLPSEGYRMAGGVELFQYSTYYCSESAAKVDGYVHK